MARKKIIGSSNPRGEGVEKVTGQAVYAVDVALPGMLWAKALRSPIPYGRIMVGRNITLGPKQTTRRTLAHEFGHLLGFSDAYLRSYEGDPRDPYGVVLLEWTGLIDNLMGSPVVGRVTEAMIETLIDAYRKPQHP